ncbi:hypothetical protein LPJ79_004042 [Coemansia sp. RSA 1821]|nr:hypothetical protein LPJ79_004042 [Coemansia sp. RSA 1821]
MFMLTLPSHEFGHFCDISQGVANFIKFTHRKGRRADGQESVLVDAVAAETNDGSMLETTENTCIYQNIPLCKMQSRVFKVEYQGNQAILKIAWKFANYIPEAAIYDALQTAKVPNTPVILDSGIINQNTFDCRLEYAVMEYAGAPLIDFTAEYRSSVNTGLYVRTNYTLTQVVGCLARAWQAGIVHRDVSRGNVLVRGKGSVTLIDWGYARLLSDGPADTYELATKWHYNKYDVACWEDRQNHCTGTPLYMSIPILVRSRYRTVVNDVESMFYVALEALSVIENNDKTPVALAMEDNISMAYVRRLCLASKDTYKERFGVYFQDEQLDETLSQLYDYLFTSEGKYIGHILVDDLEWERPVDINRLLQIAKIEPVLT